jgi:hypothetical protein
MNPDSSPTDGANAWLAAGVPNPPLTDDELFAYACEDFDLVDPRQIELELARDPVARHRLRQIEAQVLAQRDREVFEGLAARRVSQAAPTVVPASTQPVSSLVEWARAQGRALTLYVRQTANALEADVFGETWLLAPGAPTSVLGARSATSASQGSGALVIQIRDRAHNQITVTQTAGQFRIEIVLQENPGQQAGLQLDQEFPSAPATPAVSRTAVVSGRTATFPACLPGLHHLTGVPALDVWILIEVPSTSIPAQP